jgi:competence protein ComEA
MPEQIGTRIRFACVAISALFLCLLCVTHATKCAAQSSAPQPSSSKRSIPPPEARVDINHAGIAELEKVPGITPSWAGRIVRFRPYRTKQDLLDRGVLPSDVYDRIKDYVIAHREKQ